MKISWPFTVKKKIETPSDFKLEEIKNILFPPLELKEDYSKEGDTIKYHVDYSVDMNLDAVLIDLQEGHNDSVSHNTINNVINRLMKVREILEAYRELDENAKYIIVDTGENENEVLAKE